jgi:hypothetical protein
MEWPRQLHLSLDLEPSELIRGSVHGEHDERREFEGWMELAAALRAAMDACDTSAPPGG